MATTEKAIQIAHRIKDRLAVRLASQSVTVTEGFGTSGDPTVTASAGAAGSKNAFIRVVPVTSLNKDILGLTQNVFTPHIIQVAVEKGATSTYPVIAGDTWDFLLPLLAEVLAPGTKVEVYQSLNTVVPVEASITGVPAASIDSLYWPGSGQ